MTSRRDARAYTLVEVLIVVTIIALVGAVVVPHMLKAGTMQVQAAGRMVITDIIFAQNHAIAHQATRRLVFDTVNNRYRITDSDGTTITANWKSGAQYQVDLSQDSRFRGVRLENVAFGGTETLEFDDLGTPISGGSLQLVAAGRRYQVDVAPFTGRLTIAPVEGE